MIRRTLCSALPACLLLLALAGPAAGHASLVESDPPDGGSLERTPATLSAHYDEELDPDPDLSWIRVRNDAGEVVARGGVTADDDTLMTVELPPLPPGEYTARWQARTPDDEGTTRGTIGFTIERSPATPTPVATAALAMGPTPTASRPHASPTAMPAPSAPRTLAPSPSPSPPATEPAAADLLLALLVAGAGVVTLVAYLLRRGRR